MTAGNRKWWALGALTLVSLVIGLDLMVLNVALPTLAPALNASTSDLQWFANSYSLVMAAALLPAGLLGDRYGRKGMLLAALVLFGVASLACAYCTNVGELIAARAALGLGAAALMPLAMSMLTVLFPPDERPRAIAIWVTANSIGVPLGPIVGGALLDRYWWGSVFLINVPVAALTFVVAAILLPRSRSDERPRIDYLGVLTSSAGLVAFTYGAIRAGDAGWHNPAALACMIAGAALFTVFLLLQRREGPTLVDLSLFRSKGFLWGSAAATVASFAMYGVFFALPQFFQDVAGHNALGTGIRLLPVIGGLLVGAQLADRVARRVGPGILVASGSVVFAAGLIAGGTTATGSGYAWIGTWLGVVGVGIGLSMPSAMNAALGALSNERSGVGSALIEAVQQVGGALGIALLGTVLNAAYRGSVHVTGLPDEVAGTVRRGLGTGVAVAEQMHSEALLASVRGAFTTGMDRMLIVSGLIAALGVVIGFLGLPRRPVPPAAGSAADRAESDERTRATV